MKAKLLIFAALVFAGAASAQNNRLNHYNTISWYNYFGTFKLSKKLGVHTEYQWRRSDFAADAQQSLLRTGINYQATSNVLFRVGYAWIETFPYGEFPINALGKDFTEHRIFEMVQLSHKEGRVEFSHRFMLEQRFVGKYNAATDVKENAFPLLNRMRYMGRLQVPLKGKAINDKTPYAALYDEIFIGFGKNVTANVFDQNRIGVLLGYRFNKSIRVEAGYLNQTVQFGRQINGKNVFQNNNGLIVNANFNFDLTNQQR